MVVVRLSSTRRHQRQIARHRQHQWSEQHADCQTLPAEQLDPSRRVERARTKGVQRWLTKWNASTNRLPGLLVLSRPAAFDSGGDLGQDTRCDIPGAPDLVPHANHRLLHLSDRFLVKGAEVRHYFAFLAERELNCCHCGDEP